MNKKLDIYLAGPRGFCAGVDRAILMVQEALKKYGSPVYVRHEIVHNKYVVDSLKAEGAIFIEELSDLRPVGGLHIRRGVWSTMFSYSGTNEHFTLSRQLGNHTASIVYWGLKYPGVAWTYRF